MPFFPDAIRVPWNRVPAKAGPGTTLLYPKSDNAWYSKDPNGVETFVGGQGPVAADFTQTALAADYTLTTSYADTGLTKTVTNPGTSAIWKITASLDVICDTDGASIAARLVADGTNQNPQIVWDTTAAGPRSCQTKCWLVTGLAAGSRVFKVQATAASGTYRFLQTHSIMIVERLL